MSATETTPQALDGIMVIIRQNDESSGYPQQFVNQSFLFRSGRQMMHQPVADSTIDSTVLQGNYEGGGRKPYDTPPGPHGPAGHEHLVQAQIRLEEQVGRRKGTADPPPATGEVEQAAAAGLGRQQTPDTPDLATGRAPLEPPPLIPRPIPFPDAGFQKTLLVGDAGRAVGWAAPLFARSRLVQQGDAVVQRVAASAVPADQVRSLPGQTPAALRARQQLHRGNKNIAIRILGHRSLIGYRVGGRRENTLWVGVESL